MKAFPQVRIAASHISQVLGLILTIVLLVPWAGCKDSPTEPESSGQISMTSQYSPSDSPSGGSHVIVPTKSMEGSGAIDSLRITRARFVLRDIKYKTQSDSSNFRAAPFVLELNLSTAVQDISMAGVPLGTYRRIEFDIHRIDTNDVRSLPASERPQFQDFLDSDRYSIIVSGTTYSDGRESAFTFRSRVSVKQKIDLAPPFVLNRSSSMVNATMLVSSGTWFTSVTGGLLDPADPQNENTISDNFRASIKVFKDNNKGGSKAVVPAKKEKEGMEGRERDGKRSKEKKEMKDKKDKGTGNKEKDKEGQDKKDKEGQDKKDKEGQDKKDKEGQDKKDKGGPKKKD